jgi:6-phosphogluconolactonase
MPEPVTRRIFADAASLNQAAAQLLTTLAQEAVAEHGRFSIALSGGGTPTGVYQRWGQPPFRDAMPWRHTHLFWGDERLVPPDDEGSNYRQIADLLLPHVPIPPENVHRAKGELPLAAAVADYTQELQAFAGETAVPILDVVLLGMGSDGHTASLFPGSPVDPPEWVVGVTAEYDGRPARRLSLTPTVINQARHIIFLVTGASKAATLQKVLDGPPQPEQLPAQRIQPTHGTLTWLLDTAVAQKVNREA